jgi:hypothetical protein
MALARRLTSLGLSLAWAASAAATATIAAPRPQGTPAAPWTARLTDTIETAHFVFHVEPGDGVDAERAEAFHAWAVAYLDVTPPKKIDYYKYPSPDALEAGVGLAIGGRASLARFAVYTWRPWHDHECFHLYSMLLGQPTMFFIEGMAVAHEVDPYDGDFVARDRRGGTGEPYLDMVRRWRAQGQLFDTESILDSSTFEAVSQGDPERRAYRQAGVFVAFLIERHGLDRMKELFRSVHWQDGRDAVLAKFEAVYGISLADAEGEWLDYLDDLNGGPPLILPPARQP